jgi:hypothetical protein
MKSKLRDARAAALAFMETMNPEDEIALIRFAAQTNVEFLLGPYSDQLRDALPQRTQASTALLDAIDLALDMSEPLATKGRQWSSFLMEVTITADIHLLS